MGLFSSSRKSADQQNGETATDQNSALASDQKSVIEDQEFAIDGEDTNAVSSPLDIKFRERNRRLESLSGSVADIQGAVSQISSLLLNSDKAANTLAQFIEQSKIDSEVDKRIQSENAKLSVANIEKDNTISRQARQIDQNMAEIEVLKDRASKYHETLQVARSSMLTMRQQRKDDHDVIEQKVSEIASLEARLAELASANDDLAQRNDIQDQQVANLKSELDASVKQDTELRQSLTESNELLDKETMRSQNNANELAAAQRELSELNMELSTARAEIQSLREEADFTKQASEDERRTFDNRMFGLKTDIENLGSERRVLRQALEETETENRNLVAQNRSLTSQLRATNAKFESLQRTKDSERQEASRATSKIGELNLRYNAAISDLNHQRKQREFLEQRVESLSAENRKLQEYKAKHDELMVQASEFKSLVADYQKLIAVGSTPVDPVPDTDPPISSRSNGLSESVADVEAEFSVSDFATDQDETELPDNVVPLSEKPNEER